MELKLHLEGIYLLKYIRMEKMLKISDLHICPKKLETEQQIKFKASIQKKKIKVRQTFNERENKIAKANMNR